MSESFSELSHAEAERLACLSEELGEVQQIIGKILRHGYESTHPDSEVTNRESLEFEIGHVFAIVDMLVANKDICKHNIFNNSLKKLQNIEKYLHYNHV